MTPQNFPEATHLAADEQPEYLLLPVAAIGDRAVSCWELTPAELEQIKTTRRVWVTHLTGGGPLQPLMLTVEKPFT